MQYCILPFSLTLLPCPPLLFAKLIGILWQILCCCLRPLIRLLTSALNWSSWSAGHIAFSALDDTSHSVHVYSINGASLGSKYVSGRVTGLASASDYLVVADDAGDITMSRLHGWVRMKSQLKLILIYIYIHIYKRFTGWSPSLTFRCMCPSRPWSSRRATRTSWPRCGMAASRWSPCSCPSPAARSIPCSMSRRTPPEQILCPARINFCLFLASLFFFSVTFYFLEFAHICRICS